jgi:hypothetical protein
LEVLKDCQDKEKRSQVGSLRAFGAMGEARAMGDRGDATTPPATLLESLSDAGDLGEGDVQ